MRGEVGRRVRRDCQEGGRLGAGVSRRRYEVVWEGGFEPGVQAVEGWV